MPHTDFAQRHAASVNRALEQMLTEQRKTIPDRLWQAMHYSLMAGGKRIRPVLMLECYAACGGKTDIMPATLSIECMHTYSLIHDDLPCMDDDDLRRGIPTCHVQFDEATAILAADAMQALSFELLCQLDAMDDRRLDIMRRLAKAAGGQGMVGGQALDMQAEQQDIEDVLQVEHIHLHKTGAILRYCCEAGAILAEAGEDSIEACSKYGKAIGLLFQIADDILDATATEAELGKTAGKDAKQHKAKNYGLDSCLDRSPMHISCASRAVCPISVHMTIGSRDWTQQ